jgi:hypothetical protein
MVCGSDSQVSPVQVPLSAPPPLFHHSHVIALPTKIILIFGVYAEPVSKHMEEQELEFLQFAFRWFNCLLIREVCLVTKFNESYAH